MFAIRIARIAFGVALLVGFSALVLAAAGNTLRAESQPWRVPVGWFSAGQLLAGSWLVAAGAAVIAGGLGYAVLGARLHRLDPQALLRASVLLPVAAIALALPLTLHLLFTAVVFAARPSDFNDWVQISLCLTAVTHAVFAALCVKRAGRLLDRDPAAPSPGYVFRWTWVASCIPFVLLFGMPPLLVALTGLPILPLLYAMRPWIERLGREAGALPAPLPRARVLAPRRAA